MEVLIIGISGVTCGGKTTLASELKSLIPDSIVLTQDEYCLDLKDPRHIWCDKIDHINFDIITSLDMDKMLADLKRHIGSREILNKKDFCQRETNGFSCECLKKSISNWLKEKNILLIILDGFLLYAYEPLVPFIHLKYFFTLEKEECVRRRELRVYEPPDVPGYFEQCVWPEYLKHYEEVKTTISEIIYFDSSVKNVLDNVLCDIYNYIR